MLFITCHLGVNLTLLIATKSTYFMSNPQTYPFPTSRQPTAFTTNFLIHHLPARSGAKNPVAAGTQFGPARFQIFFVLNEEIQPVYRLRVFIRCLF